MEDHYAFPVSSILVAIQHTDREPWRSIQQFNLKSGWLSRPLPDRVRVVIFDSPPLGPIGRHFDRIHERLRYAEKFRGYLYRLDNLLALAHERRRVRFVEKPALGPSIASIQVMVREELRLSYLKQLGVFSYFLENTSADYLFSTNTSNFLIPELLLSRLEEVPKELCYAGTEGNAGGPFVSGANRLMSRDVVGLILDSANKIDAGLLEDVAIGRLLGRARIPIFPLPTLNVAGLEELKLVTDEILQGLHQVRIKCAGQRVIADLEVFRQLELRFRGGDPAG